MVNPYIVGKNVYLRHPIEDDVYGGWYEWFSDEEITKYLTERHWPNSQDTQLDFYKSLNNPKYSDMFAYIGAHVDDRDILSNDIKNGLDCSNLTNIQK